MKHSSFSIVRTPETQGNYAEIINSYLVNDGYRLEETNQLSGFPLYKAIPTQGGVTCSVKNLIFAANETKPEIVLSDSVKPNFSKIPQSQLSININRMGSNLTYQGKERSLIQIHFSL
ncbi:MAG: hypothetical protein AAF915_02565 [Cyanobacteria bacterium P01_D01_bin.50]